MSFPVSLGKAGAVATAAALAACFATPAYAAGPDPGKAAIAAAEIAAMKTSLSSCPWCGDQEMEAYGSAPAEDSIISVNFADVVKHPFFETSARVDGSAATYWWGSEPYNASTSTLHNHFFANGINVEASKTPAATVGSFGTDQTASISNGWRVKASYTNVNWTGFAIWRVGHDATGSHFIYDTLHSVTATDTVVI